jgi:nifR3 family TIM-barrel protein
MRDAKPLQIGGFTAPNNLFTAPMAGITDRAFREICHGFGAGLTYTEMVSAKAMFYGNKNTYSLLETGGIPTAAQLFGSEPPVMAHAAAILDKDPHVVVIDINMGCPAPKIVKNGEGSALMKDARLVGEIVQAVAASTSKPVTVKIRKGFGGSDNYIEIAQTAERNGAKAVTLHARTREQMYSGAADWPAIAHLKRNVSIPVIGNGDVTSQVQAAQMLSETGCDGVMAARGALGNPWLFQGTTPTDAERINLALHHAKKLVEYKGGFIGVREARKHVCWYIKGIRGASAVKPKINLAETIEEMDYLLKELTK